MYDPSELIHDTLVRDRAMGARHLETTARPLPGPVRRMSGVPLYVLSTVAGVVAGGWLF